MVLFLPLIGSLVVARADVVAFQSGTGSVDVSSYSGGADSVSVGGYTGTGVGPVFAYAPVSFTLVAGCLAAQLTCDGGHNATLLNTLTLTNQFGESVTETVTRGIQDNGPGPFDSNHTFFVDTGINVFNFSDGESWQVVSFGVTDIIVKDGGSDTVTAQETFTETHGATAAPEPPVLWLPLLAVLGLLALIKRRVRAI